MNYADIVDTALSFADRADAEITSRVDKFIKMVESRVNRKLKTRKMSVRSQIVTEDDKEYYGLPSDFAGLRDIEMTDAGSIERETLTYATPEQMNALTERTILAGENAKIYYTIIADQLQIHPRQDARIMEIVYYQRLPNLNSSDTTNWLGDYAPDCYIFGILTEISAFVKDANAAKLWDDRFVGALNELDRDDIDERWSGTPMQMRVT